MLALYKHRVPLIVLVYLVSVGIIKALPPKQADAPIKAAEVLDVEGIWESDIGPVNTIRKIKDVYTVAGTDGEQGIGKLKGKTFTVAYTGSGVRVGLAIYQIEVDGNEVKLVGEWSTIPGPGTWAPETLTKIKGLRPKDEK